MPHPTAHDDDPEDFAALRQTGDDTAIPTRLQALPAPPSGGSPRLPANVHLLRGRGPSGRIGPIGQTDVADGDVIRQILDAAQTPLDAYRQQLFRSARAVHEGSSIIDWWHAGQARRAVDAACIQFARLTPTAQRRVLASLPRPRPRLVARAAPARPVRTRSPSA